MRATRGGGPQFGQCASVRAMPMHASSLASPRRLVGSMLNACLHRDLESGSVAALAGAGGCPPSPVRRPRQRAALGRRCAVARRLLPLSGSVARLLSPGRRPRQRVAPGRLPPAVPGATASAEGRTGLVGRSLPRPPSGAPVARWLASRPMAVFAGHRWVRLPPTVGQTWLPVLTGSASGAPRSRLAAFERERERERD